MCSNGQHTQGLCSYVNAILPNSRTLDGYILRQNWSATKYRFIDSLFGGYAVRMLLLTCASGGGWPPLAKPAKEGQGLSGLSFDHLATVVCSEVC